MMNAEDLKQEFETALVKHVHFKSRLRSFLYGNGLTEGPLRDPEQCGFSKWIAARMRPLFTQVPEARQLDELHQHIHRQANHLMDLHQAGHTEEARMGFADVQRTADDIVVLMRTIEAKLRTRP